MGLSKRCVRQHILHRPCPLTGAPIPGEIIWTEHSRLGCFNACAACADPRNVKTLRELNDERAAKAGGQPDGE